MKKLNLKDIKNGLSRNEMRSIKGGCGDSSGCNASSSCSTGCLDWVGGRYVCNHCCLA